jgi:folate-dependent phosphoribosylglycinamide formyltransferase PurN
MRVLLLTGDAARHRFAARALAEATGLVGVLCEAKAAAPAEAGLPPGDADVLRRHFDERTRVETRLLGEDSGWPGDEAQHVARGGVNSAEVLAWVESRRPDVVVLYGTSVVKDPTLGRFAGRLVNLHLGLSPYYRGSGTNFWPLVRAQPECVGATIHLADAQVDAGAILAQVRPSAASEDRAHELGTKTLIAAVACLPVVLHGWLTGRVRPARQDLSQGHVFRRRDFDADAVRRLWTNLDRGMMPDYLRHAADRCAAFPIVGTTG